MYKTTIFIFSIIIIFVSCESNEHIRTFRLPKPDKIFNEDSDNKIDSEFKIGWEKPDQWEEVSGHSMRLASFVAPFSNGEGDVSITTFGGESGGIGPNVNRWLGQIGLEPISDSEIQRIAIIKTGKLGEYSYFKLINPQDKSVAILASIYQLNKKTVFIKLSSSVVGIMELELDFKRFCSSFFKQD